MRLPWVSIDADGQTRGRLLGRLLGVNEHQGVGMAIALWQFGVEMSRDGDFSGEVPSLELIAAACGWSPADAQRLADALQQVGLIATHPKLRVRGLDRYRRTWEKNRNFHRISAKSRPQVPSTGALTAKTGAKDEDEDEEVNDVAKPPAPEKPKRVRKPSAAEDFFAWLNTTRASRGLVLEVVPGKATINATFGRALSDVGLEELKARYLAFLDDPTNADKDPPHPWQVFAKTYTWRKAKPATTKSRFVTEGQDLYGDPLTQGVA
jgi:hypothetical protein